MSEKVLVFGSANMDLILRVERLPRSGETVLGKDYFQALGGKGANQAVAALRAGARTTFIACVGDDALGRQALDTFQNEGLDVSRCKITSDAPTGLAMIWVEASGANMIVVNPGANHALQPRDLESWTSEFLAEHSVCVAQLETPLETVKAGIKLAHDAGCFTILNPAPARSLHDLKEMIPDVDLWVPNETEAELLSDVKIDDENSAARAIEKMIKDGFKNVILTRGEHGSIVSTRSKVDESLIRPLHISAMGVDAVDTVAAGDTFVGSLACRLCELDPKTGDLREKLEASARWATRAAAISVTRHGAQPSLPTRAEIEALDL